MKGLGNSLDFGARMYDSRLGRWLSRDALAGKYPAFSPYNFTLNNPIAFLDPDGNNVKIHVGNVAYGTTTINLFSASEIKKNPSLAKYTAKVPVYEVTMTNESGSTAHYYFTRVNYRGDSKSGNVKNVTFDVRKDGDKFNAVIKSRWGGSNNVLELRNSDNGQTIKGMRGSAEAERTAIQMHVKGASDGCLLCVGKDQFVTKDKDIDATNLKGNSKQSQASFMQTIQDFQKEDEGNKKGTNIEVEFDKNTSNEAKGVPEKVTLPEQSVKKN